MARPSSVLSPDQKAHSNARPRAISASRRTNPGPRENEQTAEARSLASAPPVEPEDAYLTGVSRSLQRRLLGLNVEGWRGRAKSPLDATAGLHSTGSYTGAQGLTSGEPPKAAKKGMKNMKK